MSDEDTGDVDREAVRRQRQRAEIVEDVVREMESRLDDPKYPVRGEELAQAYADQPLDLPNETETLGDLFDRVGERFDSRQDVREALYGELTGEAAGAEEYNLERDLDQLEAELGSDDPLDQP